jgi:hypothetical protein
MLHTGIEATLRGCELGRSTEHKAALLTWGDIDFSNASRQQNPEVVIWVVPAKKRGVKKKVEVPLAMVQGDWGSAGFCLVKLKEMLQPQDASPVFTRTGGEAYTTADIAEIVKMVGKKVGKEYEYLGAHSLRIGGATQLFENGASPDGMKAAGRWDADMAHVYLVVTRNRLLRDNMKAFHGGHD